MQLLLGTVVVVDVVNKMHNIIAGLRCWVSLGMEDPCQSCG